MKKILVTGSMAYDVLLGYDGSFKDAIGNDTEKLSVSFFSPRYARHHGGTGSNISWNLASLGGKPVLVTDIGYDGGEYRDFLKERGADVRHVRQHQDHVTATAVIGTDNAERQIAFFHPGADAHGTWPDLNEDRDDFAYAIVSPRNPLLVMEAVRWCGTWKVPLLFDPGQIIIALSKDELITGIKTARGVICNNYEWDLLSQKTGMNEKDVVKHAEYLIITRGEAGVTIMDRGGKKDLPACKPDQVVNPTGAGDALRAGLLFGLSKGWDLHTSVQLGAAVASLVVEQEGTLIADMDIEEIDGRVYTTYGQKMPPLR